jgi:hypothetical protein
MRQPALPLQLSSAMLSSVLLSRRVTAPFCPNEPTGKSCGLKMAYVSRDTHLLSASIQICSPILVKRLRAFIVKMPGLNG